MFTHVLPYIIYNLLIYSNVTKVTNVTKNCPQSQCEHRDKRKAHRLCSVCFTSFVSPQKGTSSVGNIVVCFGVST